MSSPRLGPACPRAGQAALRCRGRLAENDWSRRVCPCPEPADFANTIEALERSGRLLTRIGRVFDNLTSSATNEALDAIDRDYAPRLAAHHTRIMLDARLFARVDALHRKCDGLGLAPDQHRLLERYHLRFVRAGALLDPEQKARMAAIT